MRIKGRLFPFSTQQHLINGAALSIARMAEWGERTLDILHFDGIGSRLMREIFIYLFLLIFNYALDGIAH
jgi:hypothetical protein